MSTDNKIFKMSLDVSCLIINYKKALKTMQNFGGPSRTLTSFEQSIRKLETEFSNLQRMGREGISKDPSAVNTYTKAVDKAYRKLVSLGDEMAKVGRDTNSFNIHHLKDLEREIQRLTKEAQNFQGAFSKGLQGIGFNKNDSNIIAQEVRTEEQLLERLQQELTARRQISQEANKAFINWQKQVQSQIETRASNIINPNGTSAIGLTEQARNAIGAGISANRIQASSINDFIQHLNVKITNNIKNAEKFNDVWNGIVNTLTKATELPIERIFGDTDVVKRRMQAAYISMNEALNIHTNPTARAQDEAKNRVLEIQSVIDQVRNGSSELITSLNNVNAAEQNVINAESQRAAATQRDAQETQRLAADTRNLAAQATQAARSQGKFNQQLKETATSIKKTESSISRFAHMIGSMFSLYTIFATIRTEIRKTYEDIKTLDKSFASIAMVTDKSVQDMWATYGQYANMAAELGQKTNSVIEASALFYQQG